MLATTTLVTNSTFIFLKMMAKKNTMSLSIFTEVRGVVTTQKVQPTWEQWV